MASIQDIDDLIESFSSGRISPAEFANSFRSVFQSALKSSDSDFRSFALVIHAQISHHFNGLISEDDFRTNIASFRMGQPTVVVSVSHPVRPAPLNEAWSLEKGGQLVSLELVAH
jgi:hypothetical protein